MPPITRRDALATLAAVSLTPRFAVAAVPRCGSLGADRLTYVKRPQPVFAAGDAGWEAGGVLHIAVCRHEETYFLYDTAVASPGYGYRTIGVATSADGVEWTRGSDRPVLTRGTEGSFDDVHLHMPSVLFDAQLGKFRMWYAGYQNNRGNTIGYAESDDGLNWTKHGQVLSYGPEMSFDSGSLREPSVMYDAKNRLFKMWYSGTMPNQHYGPTGYAISEDGIHWGKVAAINGDQERFIGIHVVQHRGCYHGWYGTGPHIGYANSLDGLHWQWADPELVITPSPGTFDARYVQAPVVLLDEAHDRLQLWYNGATANEQLAIGYAEAKLI